MKFYACMLVLLSCVAVLFAQDTNLQYKSEFNTACQLTDSTGAQWWADRHNALKANLEKSKCDVLFVGDSITHYWDKNVWDIMFAPYNPVNFGISGDKTDQVLWRIEDSKLKTKTPPKLCFIHIGTNNTGHYNGQQDPKNTADGIKAIADKILSIYPKTHVVILSVFPRGANPEDTLRKHNDLVNAELIKISAKNISVVDIGPRFLKEDGTFKDDTAPDLLHFSPKGYLIWAEAIMPYIHKYVGNRTPVIQPSNASAPKLKLSK